MLQNLDGGPEYRELRTQNPQPNASTPRWTKLHYTDGNYTVLPEVVEASLGPHMQVLRLEVELSFLGTARVVGWLGLMLGTFIYNRHLKYMTLRSILMCAHIGLAFLNLLQIVVVSRKNIAFGVSDKIMMPVVLALADGINQFKFVIASLFS
ncbi:folate-biopterin transporter 4 [Spatholobus suberectus]|nr:folate-biopterin transporter 4 [Spatholobus suberectus]